MQYVSTSKENFSINKETDSWRTDDVEVPQEEQHHLAQIEIIKSSNETLILVNPNIYHNNRRNGIVTKPALFSSVFFGNFTEEFQTIEKQC